MSATPATLVPMRRGDDCLRACAATVLGLPYEDTPPLTPDEVSPEAWWAAWMAWADDRGEPLTFHENGAPLPIGDRLWLAALPSLTVPGREHVVVMDGETFLYDPAPGGRSAAGLDEVVFAITFGDHGTR